MCVRAYIREYKYQVTCRTHMIYDGHSHRLFSDPFKYMLNKIGRKNLVLPHVGVIDDPCDVTISHTNLKYLF